MHPTLIKRFGDKLVRFTVNSGGFIDVHSSAFGKNAADWTPLVLDIWNADVVDPIAAAFHIIRKEVPTIKRPMFDMICLVLIAE